MTKTKSGLVLIVVGVGLNVLGRFTLRLPLPVPSLLFKAGLEAILMIASVVIILFGLFRLIVGLLSNNKQTKPDVNAATDDTIWPPAPRPPDAT